MRKLNLKSFSKNLVFLGLGIIVGLGAFYLINKSEIKVLNSDNKNNDCIRITEEVPQFSYLNLPLNYFNEEDVRWGSAQKELSFDYASFDGEDTFRSYPTTKITLKDFSSTPALQTFINTNLKEEKTYFDVDSDKIKEIIVSGWDSTGNHPPHYAEIIKNGEVIFRVDELKPYILPHKTGNGFYVEWISWNQVKNGQCCPTGHMRTRFVYDGGQFKPVWEQEEVYLKVGNPK